MNPEEIKSAALGLDFHARGALAAELLRSLDAPSEFPELSEEEHDRLWMEEVERRRQECLSGKAKMIPLEDVLARVRSLLS